MWPRIVNISIIIYTYIKFFVYFILGGLLLSVQDSACAEEVDQITQDVGSCSDNTSNLLSSGICF